MGGESCAVGGTERLFQRLCIRGPWSCALGEIALPEESMSGEIWVAGGRSGFSAALLSRSMVCALGEIALPKESMSGEIWAAGGRNGFFSGFAFAVHGLRSRRDRAT